MLYNDHCLKYNSLSPSKLKPLPLCHLLRSTKPKLYQNISLGAHHLSKPSVPKLFFKLRNDGL